MDSLRLSVLTPHHATTGCKCRECFGLAEFMASATGNTHGLPPTEGPQDAHALVLSLIGDECDGTLTCGCSRCENERERLLARPRKAPKQPWDLAA